MTAGAGPLGTMGDYQGLNTRDLAVSYQTHGILIDTHSKQRCMRTTTYTYISDLYRSKEPTRNHQRLNETIRDYWRPETLRDHTYICQELNICIYHQ